MTIDPIRNLRRSLKGSGALKALMESRKLARATRIGR